MTTARQVLDTTGDEVLSLERVIAVCGCGKPIVISTKIINGEEVGFTVRHPAGCPVIITS